MISQVVLATKAFATDITGKRSFVGVSALVYHQVVRFGKLAVACAADKLLTMSANPHKTAYQQIIAILLFSNCLLVTRCKYCKL